MEPGRTWIVKARMSKPQPIPDVPDTGSEIFTADDVELLHRRLRDEAPVDWPRRLVNASIDNGALLAFFETSTEPSLDECKELWRLTIAVLPVFGRPGKFECEKTFPIETQIDYRP